LRRAEHGWVTVAGLPEPLRVATIHDTDDDGLVTYAPVDAADLAADPDINAYCPN
jgi:hypothetical protein